MQRSRVSSQNDNDRYDQSRNVLLKRSTLLVFWKGEQGGRRGPTEDETARDQATPPDTSSLGAKDQSKASGGSGGVGAGEEEAGGEKRCGGGRGGFESATDAAADETS